MLNGLQRDFLNLVKKYLIQSKDDLQLSTEYDWEELYKISESHFIVPMVYDALADTSYYNNSDDFVKTFWKENAWSLMAAQTRRTDSFLAMYEKIRNSGITALVVKGIICRNYFPKPDTRLSNDEDLFIQEKDLEACDRILRENGFTREASLENHNYEILYRNCDMGVDIDLHTSLFSTDENRWFNRFNLELKDAFETYRTIEINGKQIDTLNPTNHFFYVLFHCYKHLIHCGFGVRQLCDLLMMSLAIKEEVDWNNICRELKNVSLYYFLINLFDIGEKYLGFDWNEVGFPRPDSDKSDERLPNSDNLLMDILDAGLYGKSNLAREHSLNITLSAVENQSGKISLRKSIFRPYDYMRQKYSYVDKHPWLLPIGWIHRIAQYIKEVYFKKKTGEKTDSIAVGKQRVELLKQYELL